MTSKTKGYLVLAVVFVLGAAAGGGAMFAYSDQRHAALLREDGKEFESRRLHALSRKLDLDADQESRIRTILQTDRDDSRQLSRAMLQRCGQPLRDHKTKVDADIRAVLRPDQQARYDKLVAERRERVWLGPRKR